MPSEPTWLTADLIVEFNKLAKQMNTSRTQVDRVLDPEAGNVTIETLRRAAELVGTRVKIELIAAE